MQLRMWGKHCEPVLRYLSSVGRMHRYSENKHRNWVWDESIWILTLKRSSVNLKPLNRWPCFRFVSYDQIPSRRCLSQNISERNSSQRCPCWKERTPKSNHIPQAKYVIRENINFRHIINVQIKIPFRYESPIDLFDIKYIVCV